MNNPENQRWPAAGQPLETAPGKRAGLSDDTVRALVSAAAAVRQRAYAPYSAFAVGAALLAEDGTIYVGCNVENASYGLTLCAERSAIATAVSQGARRFAGLAVVTENGVTPCGACRQVLAEFSPDLLVIVADLSGQTRVFALRDLLPDSFGPQDLLTKPG